MKSLMVVGSILIGAVILSVFDGTVDLTALDGLDVRPIGYKIVDFALGGLVTLFIMGRS